jgi:hypothetical protein
MRKATAIKLGIEALHYRSKSYAVDANIYVLIDKKFIGGERALKKMKRIEEAIKHLEEML